MYHKGCGGKLLINCNSLYKIGSPSIKITVTGIVPGPIEISSSKNSKVPVLQCSTCDEELSTKVEFESKIVDTCAICEEEKKPSELLLLDMMNNVFICTECASSTSSKDGSRKSKLLELYAGLIKKSTGKTLLDILMIKK